MSNRACRACGAASPDAVCEAESWCLTIMQGWSIPPPIEPTKSGDELRREREEKVRWFCDQGYLRSERIKQALLKIPREDFIPLPYRDYAYLEVPLPLPGQKATVSCPYRLIAPF